MPSEVVSEPLFLLIVSLLIVLSILVKTWAAHVRVPPVVGFIALGALLRLAHQQWGFMADESEWTLEFLAHVGVAALLFHVGLRSDVKGLVRQLPRASFIWVWNVVVSAGCGFGAAWILGWGLVPALFVGVAMSATSVGISISVWEGAKLVRSRLGELLIDVAELDDVSAVLLMLAAVAAAPLLHEHGSLLAARAALGAVGTMLLKVALFAAGCLLFARFVVGRMSAFLVRTEKRADRVLTIMAIGFAVAALAGWIGFSVAVGALFAGLIFSRDAEAVRGEGRIEAIYTFFTPFFFIDIGYALDPAAFGSAATLGLILFIPAVVGKVVGGGVPVLRSSGLAGGLLIGVSLVPRAEVALLVARTGNRLGSWALPDEAYGGLVVAFGLASIVAPLVLDRMLKRWSDLTGSAGDPTTKTTTHA